MEVSLKKGRSRAEAPSDSPGLQLWPGGTLGSSEPLGTRHTWVRVRRENALLGPLQEVLKVQRSPKMPVVLL
jgi:hypothetical protein